MAFKKKKAEDKLYVFHIIGAIIVGSLAYFLLIRGFILIGIIILPIFVGTLIALGFLTLSKKYSFFLGIITCFPLGIIYNEIFNKLNFFYLVEEINPIFTVFLMFISFSTVIILPLKNKYKPLIPLGILTVYFFANAVYIGHKIPYGFRYQENFPTLVSLIKNEPEDEIYRFDGFIYLKTFFLLKKGQDFYTALPQAIIKDGRMETTPTALFNYRLPTIYYIWSSLLPANGVAIFYLFIILSCSVLIASYFICKIFIKDYLSLLSSIFVFNYFLYGATSLWLTMMEYWGSFFAIGGIWAFLYQRKIKLVKYIALFLLFLSSIIREHFLYLNLAGFVSSLLHKEKKYSILWGVSIIGFILFLIFHYLNLKPYLLQTQVTDTAAWLFKGSLKFLHLTMNFGMSYYPYFKVLSLIFIISSVIGVIFIRIKYNKLPRFFLFLVIVLPLLGFSSIIGLATGGGEYWGVIYMPFCLIFSPLIFQLISKFRK